MNREKTTTSAKQSQKSDKSSKIYKFKKINLQILISKSKLLIKDQSPYLKYLILEQIDLARQKQI